MDKNLKNSLFFLLAILFGLVFGLAVNLREEQLLQQHLSIKMIDMNWPQQKLANFGRLINEAMGRE